jgi:hypothetical protein
LPWQDILPVCQRLWHPAISFPLYAINLPVLARSKVFGRGAGLGIVSALALATHVTMRFDPSTA